MVVPGQVNRSCSREVPRSISHVSALSSLRRMNTDSFLRQPDWFSGCKRLVLWMVSQTSVGQRFSMGEFYGHGSSCCSA